MAKKKLSKKAGIRKQPVRKKKVSARKKAGKKTAHTAYEHDLNSASSDALAMAGGVTNASESTEDGVNASGWTELTIYNCNKFHEYAKSVALPGKVVELDLSAIEEMDTSGFQVLLSLRNALRAGNGELKLRNPSATVSEVLQRYHYESEFVTV